MSWAGRRGSNVSYSLLPRSGRGQPEEKKGGGSFTKSLSPKHVNEQLAKAKGKGKKYFTQGRALAR